MGEVSRDNSSVSMQSQVAPIDIHNGLQNGGKLFVKKDGSLAFCKKLSIGEAFKAFFGRGPAALQNIVKSCQLRGVFDPDVAVLVEKHNSKIFRRKINYTDITTRCKKDVEFKEKLSALVQNMSTTNRVHKKAHDSLMAKIFSSIIPDFSSEDENLDIQLKNVEPRVVNLAPDSSTEDVSKSSSSKSSPSEEGKVSESRKSTRASEDSGVGDFNLDAAFDMGLSSFNSSTSSTSKMEGYSSATSTVDDILASSEITDSSDQEISQTGELKGEEGVDGLNSLASSFSEVSTSEDYQDLEGVAEQKDKSVKDREPMLAYLTDSDEAEMEEKDEAMRKEVERIRTEVGNGKTVELNRGKFAEFLLRMRVDPMALSKFMDKVPPSDNISLDKKLLVEIEKEILDNKG